MGWLARRRCPHENVRCIHGDEIIGRNWKRSICRDCGKTFDVLPVMCAVTGGRH